jgi:hypothetical protein
MKYEARSAAPSLWPTLLFCLLSISSQPAFSAPNTSAATLSKTVSACAELKWSKETCEIEFTKNANQDPFLSAAMQGLQKKYPNYSCEPISFWKITHKKGKEAVAKAAITCTHDDLHFNVAITGMPSMGETKPEIRVDSIVITPGD